MQQRSLISSGWMSSAHRCIQPGTHPVEKPNDGSRLWNLLQIGKLLTCPLQTWDTASSPSCPSNPPSCMFPVLRGPRALRERIRKPEWSCGSSLLSLGLSFIGKWRSGLFSWCKQCPDKMGACWREIVLSGWKHFPDSGESAEPWPTAQPRLILSSSETSPFIPPKYGINKLFWKTSKLFEKVHYGILFLYAKWLFNKIASLNFSHE